MAGIRELRGRIKSVGNIKQITRAMEMVATTKLRKFQDRAVASRPYAEEITGLVGRLAAVLGDEIADKPLFMPREGGKRAVLVVTSDRGLCGSYNSNLLRALEAWRSEDESHRDVDAIDYFVYGRKGFSYLSRRGHNIAGVFDNPELEKIDYRGAARTAQTLVDGFLDGTYSRVQILYSAFESMARYVPTWIDFLPIQASSLVGDEDSSGAMAGGDVILEPDAEAIFDRLVPRYLETRMYNALVEALTSEYASRRMSMKNATDAAGDMQNELQSIYNRKRQEGITKDLLDIVGGAEALR
ncbi:MAG TPA: ATP synthase F1 subunit gamma [Planctomycetes bacterium]|nr:ATP synthase F1 subunit gamma [Planctomycetota bacterium]